MNILFLDDDELILNSLNRSFFNSGWNIFLTTDGFTALDMLRDVDIDVVVSDMHMPIMNGADFLEQVSVKYPSIVRLVLSGHAEENLISKASFFVHQWFSKPCDVKELQSEIDSINAIRSLFPEKETQNIVGSIKFLPSPLKNFIKIKGMVESQQGIDKISELISKTPSLVAKILQLCNSSFFMSQKEIMSINEAVIRLGLDIVVKVVMLAEVHSKINCKNEIELNRTMKHCIDTSNLVKKISPTQFKEIASVAALLHDTGELIFYHLDPNATKTYRSKRVNNDDNTQLESNLFGTDHTRLAGYLLHLWHFPYTLIESVILHHNPREIIKLPFGPAAVVYIASTLISNKCLDDEFVQHFNLADNVEYWTQCRKNLNC